MTNIKTKIQQMLALPDEVKLKAFDSFSVFTYTGNPTDKEKIVMVNNEIKHFERGDRVRLYIFLESKLPPSNDFESVAGYSLFDRYPEAKERAVFFIHNILRTCDKEGMQTIFNWLKGYVNVEPPQTVTETVKELIDEVKTMSKQEYDKIAEPERGRDLESVEYLEQLEEIYDKYAESGYAEWANLLNWDSFQKAVQELQQSDWFPTDEKINEKILELVMPNKAIKALEGETVAAVTKMYKIVNWLKSLKEGQK